MRSVIHDLIRPSTDIAICTPLGAMLHMWWLSFISIPLGAMLHVYSFRPTKSVTLCPKSNYFFVSSNFYKNISMILMFLPSFIRFIMKYIFITYIFNVINIDTFYYKLNHTFK
jgi:hypothetical protein